MKGTLLFLALLTGCASASTNHYGRCGAAVPVNVIVDSNQFADVVIRDAEGRRLGIAEGHSITRFPFCAYTDMPALFILDPIGGTAIVVEGGMGPTPGSTVKFTLGSELRISFVFVMPPGPPQE